MAQAILDERSGLSILLAGVPWKIESSPHLDTEQHTHGSELVFVQEWNELEDEFEEKCGGQKMSILTHSGRRQTGRQRQDKDGGRQVDLARKSAGSKALEGEVSASARKKPKNRKREGGKDHELKVHESKCSVHSRRLKRMNRRK